MRRTTHRHVLLKSQQPASTSKIEKAEAWPSAKSWRYGSDWNDDIVRVNVSNRNFPNSSYKSFDLGKIAMDVRSKLSSHTKIQKLHEFRGLIKSLKIGINSVCHRNDEGDVFGQITEFLTTCVRFFIWCIRKGIHNLADVTPVDFGQCIDEVRRKGWFKILHYRESFQAVLKRAMSDKEFAESLKGSSEGAKYLTVNLDAVANSIGLPISAGSIPKFFADGLSKVHGDDRKQPTRKIIAMTDVGVLIRSMRLLSMLPFCDSLPFPSYDTGGTRGSSASSRREQGHPKSDGRTRNLPLPQAIALLEQSLKWTFDYYPAVIELLEIAIDSCPKQTDKTHPEKVMLAAVKLAYPSIKEKYRLPFESIELNFGENSLRSMVGYLMTATMCLIAINHGRRRNEILGNKKNYGLYYGCVRSVAPESDNKKIEIYIEKTLRDYATLWCNVLVQRCVEKLETVWVLFNKLNGLSDSLAIDSAKKKAENIVEQRRRKLFVLPVLSQACLTGKSGVPEYNWDKFAPAFFAMAGVDLRRFSGRTHQFRRLFAILYVYRYESPELMALSQHFFHLTMDQTQVYTNDPKARKQKDRIASLYAKVQQESRGLQELLSDTRTEFLVAKIEDMLNGKRLGGAFPRLVLRFVKQLSKFSEFTELANHEKAQLVTERLEQIGYKVNEKMNGPCMVGTSRRGRRKAHCYRDGDVHPETAGPKKCQNCSFSMTTETTIKWFELDRNEVRARAENPRLSPALRAANRREADIRDAIIAVENRISEENARMYEAVEASWPLRDAA